MIKFKRTIIGTGDYVVVTEKEVSDKDIQKGDKIHICYHDEGHGKPCKIVDG